MMTCLFSVSSDHGRAGRERPRPCLGRPHSILWSHQDRHGGIHLSVHQNIPEQNLPRVPGQEVTQEKCQKLDSIAGANPPPVRGRRRGRERGRRRRRRRDKSTESCCSSVSYLHCAQLWSCPLFYLHTALWTVLLEQWAGSGLGLHCFC